MRVYFLPPRFYSTEFPYAGLKLKMVRGVLTRSLPVLLQAECAVTVANQQLLQQWVWCGAR